MVMRKTTPKSLNWPKTRLNATGDWKDKLARRLDPTNEDHVQYASKIARQHLTQDFNGSLVAALFVQAIFGGQLQGSQDWVYVRSQRGRIDITLDILSTPPLLIGGVPPKNHDPHLWYYNFELWNQLQKAKDTARKLLIIFRAGYKKRD
jgi:hypothetical protein